MQSRSLGGTEVVNGCGILVEVSGFSVPPVSDADKGEAKTCLSHFVPIDVALMFRDVNTLQDLVSVVFQSCQAIVFRPLTGIIDILSNCRIDIHDVPFIPGVDIFQLAGFFGSLCVR